MSLKTTFTFGSRTYVFRRPVLGNGNELSFTRINRRTRGGDLIIFRDADWPKTETLSMTFDFDTDAEMKAMLNMIRETAGYFINYRDHENRLWFGVIQNPDTQAEQTGRNSYRISLVFEGDQV